MDAALFKSEPSEPGPSEETNRTSLEMTAGVDNIRRHYGPRTQGDENSSQPKLLLPMRCSGQIRAEWKKGEK